jgi:hypothetical protein
MQLDAEWDLIGLHHSSKPDLIGYGIFQLIENGVKNKSFNVRQSNFFARSCDYDLNGAHLSSASKTSIFWKAFFRIKQFGFIVDFAVIIIKK